jgi:hypothetical protein
VKQPHLKTIIVILATLLSGCASVSVTCHREEKSLAPKSVPTTIKIEPARILPGADENTTKSGQTLYLSGATPQKSKGEESPLGETIAQATRKRLVKELPSLTTKAPDKPSLIVETEITNQQQGSRALRAIVGLGFGKTVLETRTLVYNPEASTTKPWLEVWTSGGSNREPGLIFAATPSPVPIMNVATAIGATASLASGVSKGLTQDSNRTGKVLATFILEKLRKAGHNVPEQNVKYAGKIKLALPQGTLSPPKKTPQTVTAN